MSEHLQRAASAPTRITVAQKRIGTQRFTAWEARSEIVRRAIDYLENLP